MEQFDDVGDGSIYTPYCEIAHTRHVLQLTWTHIGTVNPLSTNYHVNTALSFKGCSACILQIEGTLQATSDTDNWEDIRAIALMEAINGASIISSTGGQGH